MSIIPNLERQKSKSQEEIRKCQASIQKNEKAYEALRQFKQVVENSRGSFNTINSNKITLLADIQSIKNCKTAQKYYQGMKKVLSGIGVKIVGLAYGALLFSIAAKLNSYVNMIRQSENTMRSHERAAERTNALIVAERRAEQARAMTGAWVDEIYS